MKKRFCVLILCFIFVTLVGCGADSDIIGKWKAYGTKTEDGITPFEDSGLDKKTVNILKSNVYTFTDDGKVKIKSDMVDVTGDYEKKDDSYIIKTQLTKTEDSEVKCHFEEDYLVVEQILPKEYEDYDPGDPFVFVKAE